MATSNWAVIHRIGQRRIAELVLEGVPEDRTARLVREALEAAGGAARFSEGGEPWGNRQILPQDRWPAGFEADGRVERWTWTALAEISERRIGLVVSPAEWAAFTLAAKRSGLSLAEWCQVTLFTAATAPPQAPMCRKDRETTPSE